MSEKVLHLNDDNFHNEVSKGVSLVDFYADWCGPCKAIAPIIEELAEEFEGKAKIIKVDIDAAQEVATTFGVTAIPTIILVKDGQEIKRFVGIKDKDTLSDTIKSAL